MAPMQHNLRKALGAVKDQTSIGLAKVASNGAPDLDVALVKATSHDEVPVEEKHVQEVLQLTSCSRGYVHACVAGLAKRLGKTHNWIVAIKALMLIHRLLRDGDSSFEQELLYANRRGMNVLHLSDFRDDSHSNGWDFSAFVRTYALFLDERLDYAVGERAPLESRSSFNERRSAYDDYGSGRGEVPQRSQKILAMRDMKPEELMERLPALQRLLDRVLACRPTGAAKFHRLVHIALYPVVRESFQLYSDICDGLAYLLDAFFDMEHQDCVKAFEIYSRGAKQVDELATFYSFLKNLGVCRSSEYPSVPKVPEELLETMEDFLRNRAETTSRGRRQRSPDLKPEKPKSPERPAQPVEGAGNDMTEIKALPAPPMEPSEPETHTPVLEKQKSEADLLSLDKVTISSEEHGDRLALALFSGTESSVNKSWEAFPSSNQGMPSPQANGTASEMHGSSGGKGSETETETAGWELALVASASQLSRHSGNAMAGGFDRLLLDSMYDQAIDRQQQDARLPSGSASSVALPGRPASAFLALPGPATHVGEDPFSASLQIPPPPYVQMADMTKKQQLVLQEQQLWFHYERDGMQGYNGLMKLYNNPHLAPFQAAYAIPYYGAGRNAYYY